MPTRKPNVQFAAPPPRESKPNWKRVLATLLLVGFAGAVLGAVPFLLLAWLTPSPAAAGFFLYLAIVFGIIGFLTGFALACSQIRREEEPIEQQNPYQQIGASLLDTAMGAAFGVKPGFKLWLTRLFNPRPGRMRRAMLGAAILGGAALFLAAIMPWLQGNPSGEIHLYLLGCLITGSSGAAIGALLGFLSS